MEPTVTEELVGSAGWREMVALRLRILRVPLGLGFTEAQLAAEAGQIHLALRLDATLAGTVLLVPPDREGVAKLRQMAIDPAFAGRGLGRFLVVEAERLLRRRRASGLYLSGRTTAVGFYERLGFEVEGEPTVEVTIPHRRMYKTLNDRS